MAANNNNANANNNNNNRANEHIEFSVKAEEDLYLQGSEKTIRRVTAETNYSCLMLKSQRFSSLFRHYAKYHGLRKDELEYYFCDLLKSDDTPESVQLQRGDTIIVRKRRSPEQAALEHGNDVEFFKDMKELLDDEDHMDATFQIANVTMRAHKSVLTARSAYFKALFRRDCFRESHTCLVRVDDEAFGDLHVRPVLEYLYTNRIPGLRNMKTHDLLTMLKLADQWLLDSLKIKIEDELVQKHITITAVPALYVAAGSERLRTACISFIRKHFKELSRNPELQAIILHNPELCMPILQAAADLVVLPDTKKQRRTLILLPVDP